MTVSNFTVGLTGGIGGGKTTVANMFAQLGATLIDTDLIAHSLTDENGEAVEAIKQAFGYDFILPSGAMDRAKMRQHVFSQPDEKKRLESILHPLIRERTEAAAEKSTGTYTIFVVPLLVESGSWKQRVSRVLVIDCSEQTQITRVINRNKMTREQVLAIMNTQASRDQRLRVADDVIDSELDLTAIRLEVTRLNDKYLKLSKAA
ncbi:MAG: dephospho-CoA kinase [Cytophaga sp.]|nr:dephospho-CoA kinase [Undibacterium sp.]